MYSFIATYSKIQKQMNNVPLMNSITSSGTSASFSLGTNDNRRERHILRSYGTTLRNSPRFHSIIRSIAFCGISMNFEPILYTRPPVCNSKQWIHHTYLL